jgi:photosystem II stability/assembly factor-like uncharacterized protein
MPGPVVMGDRAMVGLRLAALVTGLLLALCPAGPANAASPDQAWIMPKADQSLLLDIVHRDGRWVVVGERGHILVSGDAESWTQVPAPTRVMLTAVDIGEGGTGFAVGHDATILRTRDNGESWEKVYENPEEQAPFLDVVVVDADHAVAVGAYGLYVETFDGGGSWEERILEPRELGAPEAGSEGTDDEFFYDFHLNDIEIADSGRWYIAAEAGTVYRSDDGGETWLRLPSPYEGSFFGVLPMDGDNLFLFGLQGRLYRSRDAGEDWRRIETGTDATLSSGLRLDDGRALITGYAGILLNNVDAEGNVARVRLKNRPGLSGAYLLNDGRLLSVGEGGVRLWAADVVAGQ